MFSAKQGHYWYHFYNVFVMTQSLTLGIEPGTSGRKQNEMTNIYFEEKRQTTTTINDDKQQQTTTTGGKRRQTTTSSSSLSYIFIFIKILSLQIANYASKWKYCINNMFLKYQFFLSKQFIKSSTFTYYLNNAYAMLTWLRYNTDRILWNSSMQILLICCGIISNSHVNETVDISPVLW